MEVTGVVTKGLAVIWRTEIPLNSGGILHESPVFEFHGCEWRLGCRHNSQGRVVLYLMHEYTKAHRHEGNGFCVDCYAQSQDEERATPGKSRTFWRTEVKAETPFQCLYSENQHDMEKEIADFCSHGKVAFVVIFSDVVDCLKPRISDKSTFKNVGFELKNVSHGFDFLVENEEFSDVQLKCGDCAIPAHKSVLAAHSEVFLAMFRSKMKEESSGVVAIPDVDIPVLKAFLKALYSGKFTDTSDDMVPKLYTVCDKYAVLSLKKLCSERMVNSLSEDNYQDYLLLADAHNDDDFKNSVNSFICNHPQIIMEETWLNFSDEYPKLANSAYRMCLSKLGFIGSWKK